MSESEMDLDGTGVLGLFLFDRQNAVSSIVTLTTIGTSMMGPLGYFFIQRACKQSLSAVISSAFSRSSFLWSRLDMTKGLSILRASSVALWRNFCSTVTPGLLSMLQVSSNLTHTGSYCTPYIKEKARKKQSCNDRNTEQHNFHMTIDWGLFLR